MHCKKVCYLKEQQHLEKLQDRKGRLSYSMSFYVSSQKVFPYCSINYHSVSSIRYVPVCRVGGHWFKFQLDLKYLGIKCCLRKDCIWLEFLVFLGKYMYSKLWAPSSQLLLITINSAGSYRTHTLIGATCHCGDPAKNIDEPKLINGMLITASK